MSLSNTWSCVKAAGELYEKEIRCHVVSSTSHMKGADIDTKSMILIHAGIDYSICVLKIDEYGEGLTR